LYPEHLVDGFNLVPVWWIEAAAVAEKWATQGHGLKANGWVERKLDTYARTGVSWWLSVDPAAVPEDRRADLRVMCAGLVYLAATLKE
jgi:hypothetical protein